jgi:hypothetical protein
MSGGWCMEMSSRLTSSSRLIGRWSSWSILAAHPYGAVGTPCNPPPCLIASSPGLQNTTNTTGTGTAVSGCDPASVLHGTAWMSLPAHALGVLVLLWAAYSSKRNSSSNPPVAFVSLCRKVCKWKTVCHCSIQRKCGPSGLERGSLAGGQSGVCSYTATVCHSITCAASRQSLIQHVLHVETDFHVPDVRDMSCVGMCSWLHLGRPNINAIQPRSIPAPYHVLK